MKGLAETLARELRGVGPGEALVAMLLVTAFYLEPLFGNAPWQGSLGLVCLAAGVLILVRPARIRRVPLVLVAYVAVFAVAGTVSGFVPEADKGSELARYIIRPVAIGALALFLVTPDVRRRAIGLVVLLFLPQVVVTAWQSADAVIELGINAQTAADGVTGTFGESEAGTVGLVALASACAVAGHAFAGSINRWLAFGVVVALLAVQVSTATRVAVVFAPLVAVALVLGVLVAIGRAAPWRVVAGTLALGVLAAPAIYVATEKVYPGSFTGAFSNQQSLVLEGARAKEAAERRRELRQEGEQYEGPRGVALLPGRATQLKRGVEISTEDGVRVFLLGRGFGAAAVPVDAVAGQVIPKEQMTGATWLGRTLGDTGWLGVTAFFVLLGWLALLGIRIARDSASDADRALGYALPGLAVLTVAGGAYTTILDVRGYSALFIVVAGAGFAAAHDSAAATARNGRRAPGSTPLASSRARSAATAAPSHEATR